MKYRGPKSWMWADALELLRNSEHVQRRFLWVTTPHAMPCWEPAVDLYEQGDALRLLVALPGVGVRQLEVVLEESAIVVRGERPMPTALQGSTIHRLEIPYGRFERRVTLPPGVFQLQEQSLQDGCLALLLRRLS